MNMFDDLKNKAAEMAKDALGDESRTDALLDKARDIANEKTGGKYESQLAQAREAADGRVGGQEQTPAADPAQMQAAEGLSQHAQDPAEGVDPALPVEADQPEAHTEDPAEG